MGTPFHIVMNTVRRKYCPCFSKGVPVIKACAGHAATVLKNVGLLRHINEFPKKLFVDLYLEAKSAGRDVSVVLLKHARHAVPSPNVTGTWPDLVCSHCGGTYWL